MSKSGAVVSAHRYVSVLCQRKVAKHEKITMQVKFSLDGGPSNSVYESLLRDLISSLKVLACLLFKKKDSHK